MFARSRSSRTWHRVTVWFVCDVSTHRGAGHSDLEQTLTVILQALTTREVEAMTNTTAPGLAVRTNRSAVPSRSDSTVLTDCRKSQHLHTFSPLLSCQYHGSGGQCPSGYEQPCRICGRQSGTGTGLSPISPLYPCQSIPQFLCISPQYDSR
jgi:hypothetical protein